VRILRYVGDFSRTGELRPDPADSTNSPGNRSQRAREGTTAISDNPKSQSAMANSQPLETQAVADNYAKAGPGEPAFYDLDIVVERA
jgi:hypothetical protein